MTNPWPAKIIPDARMIARIADILERVRQHPEEPRAAFQEGRPTVFLLHEQLFNLLLQGQEQLVVLRKLLQEQGVILDGPDVMNLPVNWDAVKEGFAELLDPKLPSILTKE